MWLLLLLFQLFQVKRSDLISPAWVNTNGICCCVSRTQRALRSKVASGVEIKFSTRVEETYTSISRVAWKKKEPGRKLLATALGLTEKTSYPVRAECKTSPIQGPSGLDVEF